MHVDSLATVVHWRMDSERARRERGEPALSDEDARDYIERFLPAYRFWVPQVRVHPPCGDFTTIELAEDRRLRPRDALQRILLSAPRHG
jgi:pantothenate kinase-related protein Tda10